ncbi:hypothetical protein CIHG_08178 [Coccidioides immitis H538.4]|uniref:Uncharacterized protein n=1 Tax=Coccidioides immitis H538.4 TaxID=396776 RepID=A0A0J8URT9_COCIT|nr:hypothetical protein CIHG_08178 [Coccidioides immitis H538.4]
MANISCRRAILTLIPTGCRRLSSLRRAVLARRKLRGRALVADLSQQPMQQHGMKRSPLIGPSWKLQKGKMRCFAVVSGNSRLQFENIGDQKREDGPESQRRPRPLRLAYGRLRSPMTNEVKVKALRL